MNRCSRAVAAALMVAAAGCGDSAPTEDMGSVEAGVPDVGTPEDGGPSRDFRGVEGGIVLPDLALPPCKGTPEDCGEPGSCLSCLTSSLGHACVMGACGCQAAADCGTGMACVGGQCATKGCDANAPCNGGCCDKGTCVAGMEYARCGKDGKACVACAGGTPTCTAGACSSTCVLGKPGAVGVCGQGFCCGGDDKCQAVGDKACGVAGAACRDCSKSAAGAKCLMSGACGCQSAADCQKGQACKNGACGAACDANAPCNGGCCANGVCGDGTSATACALGAALCGSCAGNQKGSACVAVNNMTACGCNTQEDCPANLACDPATKTCGTKCDANSPCNGGCCAAGTCVKGAAVNACGENGGACSNCAGNATGFLCIATQSGGHCGCNDKTQCPMSAMSCDPNGKICNTACSANVKCQVGCCTSANGGVCVNGTADDKCGASGICANCAMSNAGKVCRANHQCGCDRAEDCPAGQACDVVTRTCTTKCSANQPCNGGCCLNSTCVGGKDGKACGGTGRACIDCSVSNVGHACVAGACGCNGTSDCSLLQACEVAKKTCTSDCNPNQVCNGGCCLNGMCLEGTGNSACGAVGGACAVCQDATPTCEAGKCSPKCGGFDDGMCGNGNCCKNGKCVPGNTESACGASGACQDCTVSAVGRKCLSAMGGASSCGCETKADCQPANPAMNTPGQTCELASKTCSTVCGAAGVTTCNGGCCSGVNGQCRVGSLDTACGQGGGFCNNCSMACNPGPKCNPKTGACGCSDIKECFFDNRCHQGMSFREACSVTRGVCCIPAWFNGNLWDDNGNPANCCSGMSVDGECTCVKVGQPSMGDAARCCSQHDDNGTCSCLPTGAKCLFDYESNGECCSGQCAFFGPNDHRCIASKKDEPCQSDAGCTPPLRCFNEVCVP